MAGRLPNRARRAARLLTASGAGGGLLALLGAWLALKGPHSSLENPSWGGELLMMLGLLLASASGLVALSRFGFGLISKLDSERRPTRVKGSR